MWTSFYANVLDTGVFMYKWREVGVRHTIRLHLLTLDLWERPGRSLAFLGDANLICSGQVEDPQQLQHNLNRFMDFYPVRIKPWVLCLLASLETHNL